MNNETMLWATAVQLAREAGMEYTVPCGRNVKDLIEAGVNTMRRERRVSEADLEAAELSFSLLAGEMIRVTRALGPKALSGGSVVIREAALAQAKELCPLWPFG